MADRPSPIRLGKVSLDLASRTHIMGVLNLTPDSFSDGGRFAGGGGTIDVGRAVEAALRMVEDGADIIDVGGESTRPGAAKVGEAEETARVVPVIKAITARTDTPVSIDTYKSGTARAALDAGATIINDISGMGFDPRMPGLAAESGAAVVLMHIKGTPEDMQLSPHYDDLVGEVSAYLLAAAKRAEDAGVDGGRILLDPGIGFGKSFAHNLELIGRLDELAGLGYPLVLGVSRKAFIGSLTGGLPPEDRLEGTIAANVLGIARGASIIRVHDVRAARRAAQVTDAIVRARTAP